MVINGKKYDFNNISIKEMLEKFKLNEDKVVVEVNFKIVPKEQYTEFILNKEAAVEIVSFIGGG
ncbi:MAG: sulfur carrier protein ThiS [Clostridium sp.]